MFRGSRNSGPHTIRRQHGTPTARSPAARGVERRAAIYGHTARVKQQFAGFCHRANSHAYARTHPYGNTVAYCNSNAYRNPAANGHACTYCNSTAHAYGHASADGHAGANPHASADGHATADGNGNAAAHAGHQLSALILRLFGTEC